MKLLQDTYFTEADVQTLKGYGINALRIPIGFWYVLVRVKTNNGFTRFFAISPTIIFITYHKMEPYILNKHLTTPQRKYIIDCYDMKG